MLTSGQQEATRARPQVGLARWGPFLFIAATAFIDVVTPKDAHFDRLLPVAPALAAATWSVRGTIGIGLLSCLVEFLLGFERGPAIQAPTASAMIVIAIATAAAAYVSHVRQGHERDLSDVRAVAETAQRMVLRPLPTRLGDVDLRGLYLAAAAQARIGGDFYDAIRTPFGVRVILGDVQGKGLPAVEVAAVLLGAFREFAHEVPDLPALAGRLELSMARYSDQPFASDAAERFATAVLVEIPDGGQVARLLNRGHPPPLLLSRGGVRVVEPTAPLLPVNLTLLVEGDPHVDTIAFGPGDRIVLYTDGVTETRDEAGEFYPLGDRATRWADDPPRVLLDGLRADLADFGAGPRDDDVAVLVLRRRDADGRDDGTDDGRVGRVGRAQSGRSGG